MNKVLLLVGCVAAIVLAASGHFPEFASSGRTVSEANEIQRLQQKLAALEQRNRYDEARVRSLEKELAQAGHFVQSAAASEACSPEMLAQLVAQVRLQIHEEEPEPADLAVSLQPLLDSQLSRQDKLNIWDELERTGQSRQAIARLENNLTKDPANLQLRLELGFIYLHKIKQAQLSEKITWAEKADGAFNTVLESDPENTQARFAKAISLASWPPAYDKRGEAIEQFKQLLEHRDNPLPDPDLAQSYAILANLYQLDKKPDEALAVLDRGLALFPDETLLKDQLKQFDSPL